MTEPAAVPMSLLASIVAVPRLAFRRGSRLLASAAFALLLTAAAHTLGHFAPVPPDSPLETITEEMAAVRVPMGMGMTPSAMDIFNGLSLMVSVLLVWAGLSTLTVAAHGSRRDVQRRAWSGCALAAILALLCWHFRLPPPLISFAVVASLFAGASLALRAEG